MRWALSIEALLISLAAILAATVKVRANAVSGDAVIALLAFAMGLRNATARRVGVPDLTTTVLTLTLTGLAADSPLFGGTGKGSVRRTAAVLAMLAGALAGALLLKTSLGIPLAPTSRARAGAPARAPLRQGRRAPEGDRERFDDGPIVSAWARTRRGRGCSQSIRTRSISAACVTGCRRCRSRSTRCTVRSSNRNTPGPRFYVDAAPNRGDDARQPRGVRAPATRAADAQ